AVRPRVVPTPVARCLASHRILRITVLLSASRREQDGVRESPREYSTQSIPPSPLRPTPQCQGRSPSISLSVSLRTWSYSLYVIHLMTDTKTVNNFMKLFSPK